MLSGGTGETGKKEGKKGPPSSCLPICTHVPPWAAVCPRSSTGIPHFLQVRVITFNFYKRPTSVLIFTNWKRSRKNLCFYEKRRKAKRAFGVRFAASPYRGSVHPSSESGPSKLLPQELYSASQYQAIRALKCVCEHLCFISIYCVHPLARCVLMYQKCLREQVNWS